jgi:hypothetical protein
MSVHAVGCRRRGVWDCMRLEVCSPLARETVCEWVGGEGPRGQGTCRKGGNTGHSSAPARQVDVIPRQWPGLACDGRRGHQGDWAGRLGCHSAWSQIEHKTQDKSEHRSCGITGR